MKLINVNESTIIESVTILFFIFVSLAILLIVIFNTSRKRIYSGDE